MGSYSLMSALHRGLQVCSSSSITREQLLKNFLPVVPALSPCLLLPVPHMAEQAGPGAATPTVGRPDWAMMLGLSVFKEERLANSAAFGPEQRAFPSGPSAQQPEHLSGKACKSPVSNLETSFCLVCIISPSDSIGMGRGGGCHWLKAGFRGSKLSSSAF